MPDRPVRLVPPGGKQFLEQFGEAANASGFEQIFQIEEYDTNIRVGDVEANTFPVTHYIPCWGLDIPDVVTYAADCSAEVDLPYGCPVLILESTLPVNGDDGHMSAEEAGMVAAKHQADKLVLTHYSEQYMKYDLIRNAKKTFAGEVVLAEEMAQIL